MADNDLKIWQNDLFPNPFHMVDVKFDLVLRPISHGNPAMPFPTKGQNALLSCALLSFLSISFKLLFHQQSYPPSGTYIVII